MYMYFFIERFVKQQKPTHFLFLISLRYQWKSLKITELKWVFCIWIEAKRFGRCRGQTTPLWLLQVLEYAIKVGRCLPFRYWWLSFFTLADCGFIQLSTKETPQRIIKFTTAYTQLSSLYQFLAPYLIISGSRVYLSFTIHWK